MRFVMLKRRTATGTESTWVNIDNINTISAASATGTGSRITMRDGFLICEDEVTAVLEKIRRAENDD